MTNDSESLGRIADELMLLRMVLQDIQWELSNREGRA